MKTIASALVWILNNVICDKPIVLGNRYQYVDNESAFSREYLQSCITYDRDMTVAQAIRGGKAC